MSTALVPTYEYDALEAAQGLVGVPESVRTQMRYRALHETYYLATTVLGYNAVNPRTHGPICRFLDNCPATRRLIQDPRSHFKTTLKTVTHNMRLILNNPALRLLIVGDTDTNAENHLGKIKRHFESNNVLRWLFPQEIWENPWSDAPIWSKRQLSLRTRAPHGEPTLTAYGVGSAMVGQHFDIISIDDLIADDEYLSDTEMAKTIEWLTGIESLFATDSPIEDKLLDCVGTYWKTNDVYAFFEKFFGGTGTPPVEIGPHAYQKGRLAVFRRSAEGPDGNPIFPEAISKQFLLRLKDANPERYAAQYANNPYDAATAYFKTQYLRYYSWSIVDNTILLRFADGHTEKVRVADLEIISFCDPHAGGSAKIGTRFKSGGRAAVLTTGVHAATGRIFILDCCLKRMATDRLITEIIRQNEKWNPFLFSIEANGLQKMIEPWLVERIIREHRPTVPYSPYIPKGGKTGMGRINGLQPLFRAGQIWIQEGYTEFIEEYQAYPNGTMDGLDALSQGLSQWGVTYDDIKDEEMELYEQRVRAIRNVTTGY